MLYKVTPTLVPVAPKKDERDGAGQPRKRRKAAVYDADGNEVLISLMCLKCRTLKPLTQFGLRKMGDGAIRNQPWCRPCRSGAGTKKKAPETATATAAAAPAPVAAPPAAAPALAPVREPSATVVESARSIPAPTGE
jgi:hypothetical protein